ncbi:hypothetical protein [Halococcus sp. IIIV-5B]|uniref:DUF7509 family protein n=1 Tax=Halococcus sp. IIIV-5B TaxID=2321230 RepID=UPI000E754820|nr:hypothetical protein [Halococcus sp. IIIV-5B]RJT08041.1 hypothetical protein D3261_01515 [Halococcus sp. IIIV-5B]
MRDRIVEVLDPVEYQRFLVYIMGPYKPFDLEAVLPEDVDPDSLTAPWLAEWDGESGEYEAADVLALLKRVRDRLRAEAKLNGYLAIDVDIDLAEMDAASQSIAFARASNAVVFVAPRVGDNLGLGIEVGSVLEALDDDDRERVVFIHEDGVRSAMIAGVSRRWDATVYSYADEDDLVRQLRTFAIDIMNREQTGSLPSRDRETE